MTRQYDFHRNNESSQKDDDNWILQRSAVRSLPAKTLTPQTKSTAGDRSGMELDLTQIPVSNYSANPSPLQALAQRDGETPVQRQEEEKKAENKTGLPDRLKEGIESLSGYDLSGVRVNYNSPKPAQLNAHAYTQGQAIEVAPGQERHLPHESWHVVQQMQGRVRPTMEVNGVGVNGDRGLEQEADVMGQRAVQKPRAEISPTGESEERKANESERELKRIQTVKGEKVISRKVNVGAEKSYSFGDFWDSNGNPYLYDEEEKAYRLEIDQPGLKLGAVTTMAIDVDINEDDMKWLMQNIERGRMTKVKIKGKEYTVEPWRSYQTGEDTEREVAVRRSDTKKAGMRWNDPVKAIEPLYKKLSLNNIKGEEEGEVEKSFNEYQKELERAVEDLSPILIAEEYRQPGTIKKYEELKKESAVALKKLREAYERLKDEDSSVLKDEDSSVGLEASSRVIWPGVESEGSSRKRPGVGSEGSSRATKRRRLEETPAQKNYREKHEKVGSSWRNLTVDVPWGGTGGKQRWREENADSSRRTFERTSPSLLRKLSLDRIRKPKEKREDSRQGGGMGSKEILCREA